MLDGPGGMQQLQAQRGCQRAAQYRSRLATAEHPCALTPGGDESPGDAVNTTAVISLG